MDNHAANEKLDGLVEPEVIHDEALPEWAIEAINRGESVTLRGLHQPAGTTFVWEGPEDGRVSEEEFEEAGRFEGGGAAPMIARTETSGVINKAAGAVHPNCRSSHVTVDGDLTEEGEEAVRTAIKKAAEEVLERSKRMVPRR